jgi:glycosyltransferase involved in cell wall biosynthesis
MVANLVALKDHATLLRAWRIVLDRTSHQRLSLLLVGRFDEEATRLKALALDLGLQGSVVFLGYRPDRDWVLRAADLYVHSALFEGCPNAVLEAMEAALPVVGTAIAGIDEVIGPAGRRFLVPPSQPEALANKIASLVDDQDSRREAGAENRRRVRREFSLEGMRQRWIDLLIGGRVLDVPGGSSAVH